MALRQLAKDRIPDSLKTPSKMRPVYDTTLVVSFLRSVS